MKKNIDRKVKISNKIKNISLLPRLVVFRSNSGILAQIVDISGNVLASSSSLKMTEKNRIEVAKAVGVEVGKNALAKKIEKIVFDRRGYKYHGRVAALAEGARQAGLKF